MLMRQRTSSDNWNGSIGLGSAVDYLNGLGMGNVREHEKDLTAYALDRFKKADLEGLDLFGPDDPNIRGGVFSFNTPDVHPHDLGAFLDRMGIAVRTGHHCAMPLVRSLGVAATARASFYLYNSKKEVDVLIDGVTEALRYFRDGPK